MADLFGIIATCLVVGIGGYLSAYVMARGYWPWQRYERVGCCTTCRGTGVGGGDPSTNGLCWDCKATGHPHDGKCARWWTRRKRVHPWT